MIFLIYIEVMIDKQTIIKAKNKDSEAINVIIKDNTKLIYSIINNYQLDVSDYNLSKEDMFQEGLLGLMKAIKAYDINREVKFSTFAYPFISRSINKEYKKQYERYSREGYSYSKFEEVDHFYNYRSTYIQDNPIEYLENKSRVEILFDLMEGLDESDKTIVKLRLLSYSYEEIAKQLNITTKKVDYRLRKIKKIVQDKKNKILIN